MTAISNSHACVTNESVTLVVRLAWERLTINDMEVVFGKEKATQWLAGATDFIKLWYYATAIEQEDLLEIMNEYIDSEPYHLPRSQQLKENN